MFYVRCRPIRDMIFVPMHSSWCMDAPLSWFHGVVGWWYLQNLVFDDML